MYSSTAGTGSSAEERGSRMRAASRAPSGMGIQTGSRISKSCGRSSRMRMSFTVPTLQVVARDLVGEAAAEEPRLALEGVDIGIEDEVIARGPHADAGLHPRVPLATPVMHGGRDHGLGRRRIVAGDGELLHLAVGDGGADVVDPRGAVIAAVAHGRPVTLDVVVDLALLLAGIVDGARQGRRFLHGREIRQ